MAQVYPYQYQGRQRMKQEKCRASIPLDKARIWLDFNELVDVDRDTGAPVYLFSQADIVGDSEGEDVELYEGMAAAVFDGDLDEAGRPDALLADGIVIRNSCKQYPQVKWCIRLTERPGERQDGPQYVYWLSERKGP